LCLWLLLHFHGLHNQSSRIPHQWNRTSCFDDDRILGGIHVRNWSVLAAWAGKGRSCTKPWAHFLALTRGWMFRFLPNVVVQLLSILEKKRQRWNSWPLHASPSEENEQSTLWPCTLDKLERYFPVFVSKWQMGTTTESLVILVLNVYL
jgi:hypothetical protein